jgi:hypothetical protein
MLEVKLLFLDRITQIFYGLAHLALRGTPALLNVTARTIGFAFRFKVSIINRSTDRFLDSTFGLIKLSFEFVFVW